MSVKFIVDSASDLLPEEAEALGVTHIPLHVLFGETIYDDAVTLSHEEFYKKLAESKELPTTSQITPAVFAEHYAALVADGHDVVVVSISSKLSGTYQSAVIAAEDYEGRVFVVDSLNAAIGERILLQRGLELARQGLSAGEVAQALDEEKGRIRLVAIIDTLEYLKKGGRISATAALAGGLLSIKPAVEVKNGEVVVAGTVRGTRKSHALLQSLIAQYGGVNFNKPVAFVYSGASDAAVREFIAATPELRDRPDLPIHSLGCAIGTHVGPGACGVAFFQD